MMQDRPARLPTADWNLLFESVTYRLRHDVRARCAVSCAAQLALDDCVQALELLHSALALERGDRQRSLEPSVCGPPPPFGDGRQQGPRPRLDGPSVSSLPHRQPATFRAG